jgi:deoxyadenosine/deoxycytidine kinase/NTP pyrophosphatase (non-canonical NTP hydrolase)
MPASKQDTNVNTRFYIAIEGPIGVGKTTLARILQEELGGHLLLEVFEENPFLSDFYADRARYAFQTQIFFLLSRYRQQYEVVPRILEAESLVSDYLFAKDRLFAHLNLGGDELAVYEHIHAALGERIPNPDLIIYLRAKTDVLMNRIAFRDRSYERSISRQYIDDLSAAYERFFADYDQAPVLPVGTSELDFVTSPEDRRYVVGLVRTALQQGSYQQPLPELQPGFLPVGKPSEHPYQRRLGDFQRLHRQLDRETKLTPDLYLNYLLLTEGVGQLGKELASLWMAKVQQQALTPVQQQADALDAARGKLRDELADVLTSLLKIANDAGVDLEDAYLQRMRSRWPDGSVAIDDPSPAQ